MLRTYISSLFFRERETKYHADVESKQKHVEGNLWKAVAALINLDGEMDRKVANRSEKSPESPKKLKEYSPKAVRKTTDLSRMREVLAQLLLASKN